MLNNTLTNYVINPTRIATIEKNNIQVHTETLVDVIIHDLKERKLLIAKDSIYRNQISILKDSLYLSNNNTLAVQKSFIRSEEKRKRNGWQRNSLLFMILIFGALCTK
jgi:hypothetical protein